MSCWQSTILLLYHYEKVTFALPCVRPVRPIYGPITCNILKVLTYRFRVLTEVNNEIHEITLSLQFPRQQCADHVISYFSVVV